MFLDRVAAVVAIGGGVQGLLIASQAISRVSLGAILGLAFFALAMASGGLLLRNHPAGPPLMAVTQILQTTVVVTDSSLAWRASAGPSVVLGLSGPSLRLLFDLGSYFQTASAPGEQALFGINLVAALWLYYLLVSRDRLASSGATCSE